MGAVVGPNPTVSCKSFLLSVSCITPRLPGHSRERRLVPQELAFCRQFSDARGRWVSRLFSDSYAVSLRRPRQFVDRGLDRSLGCLASDAGSNLPRLLLNLLSCFGGLLSGNFRKLACFIGKLSSCLLAWRRRPQPAQALADAES